MQRIGDDDMCGRLTEGGTTEGHPMKCGELTEERSDEGPEGVLPTRSHDACIQVVQMNDSEERAIIHDVEERSEERAS